MSFSFTDLMFVTKRILQKPSLISVQGFLINLIIHSFKQTSSSFLITLSAVLLSCNSATGHNLMALVLACRS